MFGSMCVLMALNVVFFKMLLSVLSTIPSGLDVLPWMVLIMTIVKVAKKSDAIVTRIGLNPAITGDNLGVRFPGALTYMVIRGMTSQVTKAVGKSAGSSGRGASPNTPPRRQRRWAAKRRACGRQERPWRQRRRLFPSEQPADRLSGEQLPAGRCPAEYHAARRCGAGGPTAGRGKRAERRCRQCIQPGQSGWRCSPAEQEERRSPWYAPRSQSC